VPEADHDRAIAVSRRRLRRGVPVAVAALAGAPFCVVTTVVGARIISADGFHGLTPWPLVFALAVLGLQLGRARLVLERAARHPMPSVPER
jgi:hypothetical protein